MIRYKGKEYELPDNKSLHHWLVEFFTHAKDLEIRVQANYAQIYDLGKIDDAKLSLLTTDLGLSRLPTIKAANLFYMEHGEFYRQPGKWAFHRELSRYLNGLVWILYDENGEPTDTRAYISCRDNIQLQKITVRPIVPNPFPFAGENAPTYSTMIIERDRQVIKLRGPGWMESKTLLSHMHRNGINLMESELDEQEEE